MVRIGKRTLGKYVTIHWLDPQTQTRVELDEFLKQGFAKCEINGKLISYNHPAVILEHDKCDGELGDYTIIHILILSHFMPIFHQPQA